MNKNVITLETYIKVSDLIKNLRETTHNAYPVIENVGGKKIFRGLIARYVLITLIERRMYGNLEQQLQYGTTVTDFHRKVYPRYPTIGVILSRFDVADSDKKIDISPYMNSYPYTLYLEASLPKVFRLFRMMGLRHIVIVDKYNSVKGIITRKDLVDLHE